MLARGDDPLEPPVLAQGDDPLEPPVLAQGDDPLEPPVLARIGPSRASVPARLNLAEL